MASLTYAQRLTLVMCARSNRFEDKEEGVRKIWTMEDLAGEVKALDKKLGVKSGSRMSFYIREFVERLELQDYIVAIDEDEGQFSLTQAVLDGFDALITLKEPRHAVSWNPRQRKRFRGAVSTIIPKVLAVAQDIKTDRDDIKADRDDIKADRDALLERVSAPGAMDVDENASTTAEPDINADLDATVVEENVGDGDDGDNFMPPPFSPVFSQTHPPVTPHKQIQPADAYLTPKSMERIANRRGQGSGTAGGSGGGEIVGNEANARSLEEQATALAISEAAKLRKELEAAKSLRVEDLKKIQALQAQNRRADKKHKGVKKSLSSRLKFWRCRYKVAHSDWLEYANVGVRQHVRRRVR